MTTPDPQPPRETVRSVRTREIRWYVRIEGEGPVLLLLHGTGASSHSFRDLTRSLRHHFTVVTPDLPGHGRTSGARADRFSLPGMASAVSELLRALDLDPCGIVGHSAGAAIGCRIALDGIIGLRLLVSINGALLPFRGAASILFPVVARAFAKSRVAAWVFARRARNPAMVERLIEGTGSTLSRDRVHHYQRLLVSPAHVQAVLTMISQWKLQDLVDELPKLDLATTLVAGARDRAVPPEDAQEVHRMIPKSRVVILRDTGHLCHEERPEVLAGLIRDAWEAVEPSSSSSSSSSSESS